MKKFFMFAAMASVALVSCVKNDATPQVADLNEVTFEQPVMAPSVKSVYELADIPSDGNFHVWAYFTQDEFSGEIVNSKYMNDVEITNQTVSGAKVWKATTGKYYWPTNGYLTFVGYSGSVTDATVTSQGLGFNYKVVDGSEDLLVSQVSYNNTKATAAGNHGTATYSDGVEMIFEHALSSIVFKVKSGVYSETEAVKTELAVTKIELTGIRHSGQFSQGLTAWTTGSQMAKPMISAGSAVVTDGWNNPTGTQTYVAAQPATHQVLTGDYALVHDKTGENLTNLMVLPQDIPSNATLRITYDLRNTNMGADNWVTGQVAEAKISNVNVNKWMRGYRYTYNVTLNLDEITFDPEVSAWVDYTIQPDTQLQPNYNK